MMLKVGAHYSKPDIRQGWAERLFYSNNWISAHFIKEWHRRLYIRFDCAITIRATQSDRLEHLIPISSIKYINCQLTYIKYIKYQVWLCNYNQSHSERSARKRSAWTPDCHLFNQCQTFWMTLCHFIFVHNYLFQYGPDPVTYLFKSCPLLLETQWRLIPFSGGRTVQSMINCADG